jgi:hypothetical protein
MRVWESITIPQLGNVAPEQAVNLCFPDGQLSKMNAHPEHDFGENLEFVHLRRLSRSPLMRESSACTWISLIKDLAAIVEQVRPTIIVAPHPMLDTHPDHIFTTVALGEAMNRAGVTTGRMFFYVVHNRRSELWPFGPAGSGVTLLPLFDGDGLCASGFYSHPLSAERQRDKVLALEAIHDLRDLTCTTTHQWIRTELRSLVYGMDPNPTSYLRRAVRPDEIFFVVPFADAIAQTRRTLKKAPTLVEAVG